MKLSDIRAWLDSARDFTQGRALYAASGPSKAYQRLFSLGATEYSRQVLARELTGLVEVVEPAVEVLSPPLPPETPPTPVVPAPEVPSIVAATKELLVGLSQQLRAVRDERSHLHPQLTAARAGKKARGVVAMRIVALTTEEARLKGLEKHVLAHGRLPGPVATAEVTDESELRQRLLNLRSRRSKAKDKPEKLAVIQAEIELIQSKLIT
jgi:hypothetical protein